MWLCPAREADAWGRAAVCLTCGSRYAIFSALFFSCRLPVGFFPRVVAVNRRLLTGATACLWFVHRRWLPPHLMISFYLFSPALCVVISWTPGLLEIVGITNIFKLGCIMGFNKVGARAHRLTQVCVERLASRGLRGYFSVARGACRLCLDGAAIQSTAFVVEEIG